MSTYWDCQRFYTYKKLFSISINVYMAEYVATSKWDCCKACALTIYCFCFSWFSAADWGPARHYHFHFSRERLRPRCFSQSAKITSTFAWSTCRCDGFSIDTKGSRVHGGCLFVFVLNILFIRACFIMAYLNLLLFFIQLFALWFS